MPYLWQNGANNMKNNQIDDLETIASNTEATILNETTELAQVMQNLDNDTIDSQTNMSTIDFGANLSNDQAKLAVVIDVLERMGVFPKNTGLTRQMKRISTSIGGWRSNQKVSIVQGERSNRGGQDMMGKMMNMFKPAN